MPRPEALPCGARTLLPDPGVLEKAWIAWVNEGPRKKINVPGSHGDEE